MSARDIRAAKIAVLIVTVVLVVCAVGSFVEHESRANAQSIEQLDQP